MALARVKKCKKARVVEAVARDAANSQAAYPTERLLVESWRDGVGQTRQLQGRRCLNTKELCFSHFVRLSSLKTMLLPCVEVASRCQLT